MSANDDDFPTRRLAIEREAPGRALGLRDAGGNTDPARINQHIEGLPDPDRTRVMRDEEVERLLNDPFARLVLRRNVFPTIYSEIVDAIDLHNDDSEAGLPRHDTFLVAEGGQIPASSRLRKGGVRFITVRSNSEPQLLISSLVAQGAGLDDPNTTHEVFSWDPVNETFHFYQRALDMWFWCGQSDMALEEPTRGRGPFDSHVNGYPVMKELRTPWVHWNGPAAMISKKAFADGDPMGPLVQELSMAQKLNTADVFEQLVILPLMKRWNVARLKKAIRDDGAVPDLDRLMRQLLTATSTNLISTHTEASQLPQQKLRDLPRTFFFDADSLLDGGRVGLLDPDANPTVEFPDQEMSGARYQTLLREYDVRLRNNKGVDLPGDVHFCFTVPERAFEDVLVVQGLIKHEIISRRLAACLLMVDFANPVRSLRREKLLDYIPAEAQVGRPAELEEALVANVRAAVGDAGPDSPEQEFLDNWEVGADNWPGEFRARLRTFWKRLTELVQTDEGSDAVFRLAESRRREFRRRSLFEFDLGLPIALGIPEDAEPLEMTPSAEVRPRSR